MDAKRRFQKRVPSREGVLGEDHELLCGGCEGDTERAKTWAKMRRSWSVGNVGKFFIVRGSGDHRKSGEKWRKDDATFFFGR